MTNNFDPQNSLLVVLPLIVLCVVLPPIIGGNTTHMLIGGINTYKI